MAKLSAHGTEVYRLVQETNLVQNAPNDAKKRKVMVSLRSDFCVLRKLQVLFPYQYSETGERWHDYGWKLKFKPAAVRSQGHTTLESLRDAYLKLGFKLDV